MSKHTPGPWHFVPAGNRPEIMGDRNGVDGATMIARVESQNFIGDAHLIAAAPDLLAALEAMVASHDSYSVQVSAGNHMAAEQARAAIAKARGKS